MVPVDPQKAHGLSPARRHDGAREVDQPHVAVKPRAQHVLEEGPPILGPELAAEWTDELLVRLDRINRRVASGECSECKGDRRATSVRTDLYDASLADGGGFAIEEFCLVCREPAAHRSNGF
jgi:hypothetical protein